MRILSQTNDIKGYHGTIGTVKHKAIRVDNLMYKGCEPHWKCTICGDVVPFHCYTKEQFENLCCGCHRPNCKNCNYQTEKGGD